jgi:hypothetical protein
LEFLKEVGCLDFVFLCGEGLLAWKVAIDGPLLPFGLTLHFRRKVVHHPLPWLSFVNSI